MTTDAAMAEAETLSQADASSLVDRDVLEAQVKDMYRQVAREQEADLHFAVGRPCAGSWPRRRVSFGPAGELRSPTSSAAAR